MDKETERISLRNKIWDADRDRSYYQDIIRNLSAEHSSNKALIDEIQRRLNANVFKMKAKKPNDNVLTKKFYDTDRSSINNDQVVRDILQHLRDMNSNISSQISHNEGLVSNLTYQINQWQYLLNNLG